MRQKYVIMGSCRPDETGIREREFLQIGSDETGIRERELLQIG